MPTFVTIKTAMYPHDLVVVQSLLEAEGFPFFTKDEHTIRANPLYSVAVGGVKLQVQEDDVEMVRALLQENGFTTDDEFGSSGDDMASSIYTTLDTATKDIPFLKTRGLEERMLILTAAGLLAAAVVFGGYLLIAPRQSSYEKLTREPWCVNYVQFNDTKYAPATLGTVLNLRRESSDIEACYEKVSFRTDGMVTLPGLNTAAVHATWHIEGNGLVVSRADTLGPVYNGSYKVDFKANGELALSTKRTVLYCYPPPRK